MKFKFISGLANSLLFALLVSVAATALVGVDAFVPAFCVIMIISFIAPFFPVSQGVFTAALYREAWDRELIKRFNDADNNGWRKGIRDIGKYFSMLQDGETVVVNLAYFGVSPDILIDNSSYPIAIQTLDAENVVVAVKKFQSKATPVTDDEIYGLNYDKMGAVQDSHRVKMQEEQNNYGIHSLGCTANTGSTPVLLTTGDLDNGRRMLLKKDLLTLRNSANKLKIPRAGRRLVLCNDHINDLLQQDQRFADQYHNYTTGQIYNFANFEFYESNTNPFYHAGTKAKLSYGGTVTGNHTEASVFFHIDRVVQGKGFTKNYISESAKDPLMQRNLFNIRSYDIVVPYKQDGIGAIASAIS